MKYILYIFPVLILFASCTEPYIPELNDNETLKTLMVEGYINADGDSEYRLGYITPLYKETDSSYTRVTDARLSIEEENGQVFNDFTYTDNSRYIIHHPALKLTSKYRLRIKTGNREYLSEFVPVLVSPEIENLRWKQNIEEGLRFYLDTQSDDQAYYRWEFEEAWRFKTPNMSLFLFDGTEVRERRTHERFPLFCYMTEKSSGIHLHTTENQNENTVKDFNIHFIPNFSEKLGMRYTLLVKQYALTKEAFGYWSLVKKNSEAIGDIFGTMPTELTGNISCISHPEEKVIGMIEAGKIAEKKIAADYIDFAVPWSYKYSFYGSCVVLERVPKKDANAFFTTNPQYTPVDETSFGSSTALTHFSYTVNLCVDCSMKGSKEPPAFWEN